MKKKLEDIAQVDFYQGVCSFRLLSGGRKLMWIRLTALIVVASLINHILWPLEPIYIYGMVVGVAIPIFWFRFEGSISSQSVSPPKENKVIQLDDYRRKKKADKQKGAGQKNL